MNNEKNLEQYYRESSFKIIMAINFSIANHLE